MFEISNFTRKFYLSPEGPEEGPTDPSFTPGQIIIPEQTIFTMRKSETGTPQIEIDKDIITSPDKLLIEFDGVEYIVEKAQDGPLPLTYGDLVFTKYPFAIVAKSTKWRVYTKSEGAHTISAKIPEAKSKVFTFPKGRTIVSELSRLNKAFGTISKKKTIIGQLSDIADAAEAGKIGESGGALMVHATSDGQAKVLDKTWQEIHDALKTTSVYIIEENDEEMSVSTNHRLVSAGYSDGTYRVSNDDSAEYTTNSSDGYPKRILLNPNPGTGGGGVI